MKIKTYFIVGHNFMLSWEMPSKTNFWYSALIIDTFKGSTSHILNFKAQIQNFTGGLTGPNLL